MFTLVYTSSVLCCADLSKSESTEEVFLSNSTRTPTLGNNYDWSAFTSRSSEMPNATNATYQHQDGEVATEDLEIMLKYMGCILAFLALTYDAHTVEYVECWDPGILGSLHPQRSTLLHFVFCFPVPVCKHLQ